MHLELKFHENWAKNVTSTVTSHKNAPPTGGHVFSPIPTIFKLVRDINKTNGKLPLYTYREKCPAHWRPCFFTDPDHFHDDWTKIVTSRVFTRKTAPPTGGHVFQRIGTTFELNQDIIKTNILTNFELGRDFIGTKLLTKFHEDGTRNQMLTDGRSYDGQRPVTKAHLSNQFTSSWVGNMEIVSEKPTALTEIRFLDFLIGGQA
ncbi:hypothetical protein DPMN_027085 [Dreissena polymorpha]|uniref:Uncharacterized protein n=1 Tax=Dreissena polymorpha TaxID=45954 RepID=A0A9D4LUL3_DREPO|nr:hypothetical protein DPMN_027085 [Dreissena polymorpha]